METAQRYDGITITLRDDIGAMEDWLDDGSGLGGIDLEATFRRWAELYCHALEQQFPGASVDLLYTNGGGRDEVDGDTDYRISDDDLLLAKEAAFESAYARGSEEDFVVLKGVAE